MFNIAEGLYGPNREGHVPAICEFLGVPCHASDPLTLGLALDKRRAKEIMSLPRRAHRARSSLAQSPADARNVQLPFPLFVKPAFEGSGKGVSVRSVCKNRSQLVKQVSKLLATYAEPVLIETYLPGPEFTVAVLGNGDEARCLPIVGMDFETLPKGAPPIYGYEAKWLWDSPSHPLDIFDCPARIPEALAEDVRAAALARLPRPGMPRLVPHRHPVRRRQSPDGRRIEPAAGHFARPAGQFLLPEGRSRRRDELRRAHPHRRRYRVAPDQRPFTPGGGSLMRVAILYDAGSDEWSPQDVAAVVGNVHEVRDVLRRRGHEVELLPVRLGDFRWLSRVRRADLVFNLCEGINGHARYED